jgi:hypothetical protein
MTTVYQGYTAEIWGKFSENLPHISAVYPLIDCSFFYTPWGFSEQNDGDCEFSAYCSSLDPFYLALVYLKILFIFILFFGGMSNQIPSLVKLAALCVCNQLNTQYVQPKDDVLKEITAIPSDIQSKLYPFLHYRWVCRLSSRIAN